LSRWLVSVTMKLINYCTEIRMAAKNVAAAPGYPALLAEELPQERVRCHTKLQSKK
jgi:hypothetical protein